MAVQTKVKIYPDAAEKVTNNGDCRTFLTQVAKSAEEQAVDEAPVDTGAYRDSIRSGLNEDGIEPTAFLSADVDYWAYLEYGTINNEPFRTLTTAITHHTQHFIEGEEG